MKVPEGHKSDFEAELLEALKDDLNTSKALAVIDEMISTLNETLDANPKDKVSKKSILTNNLFIQKTLGIALEDSFNYFQFGISQEEKELIESKLSARTEAKKAKDFATSDTLRDELIAMGISIMDTADGTKWEKS